MPFHTYIRCRSKGVPIATFVGGKFFSIFVSWAFCENTNSYVRMYVGDTGMWLDGPAPPAWSTLRFFGHNARYNPVFSDVRSVAVASVGNYPYLKLDNPNVKMSKKWFLIRQFWLKLFWRFRQNWRMKRQNKRVWPIGVKKWVCA